MSARRQGLRLGAEPVRFRFDGREIPAQSGDSAASALLACGVRLTGRSVKYRRARGIFTAGCEEPNALFTVGAAPQVIPNVPGPQLAVRAGLEVRSQNRWPSLRFDAASLLQLGGGFLGAGFYYKTFMWPSWRAYEGIIRRLAGLGEAPGAGDLSAVEVEHLDTDVLVAGAGPAGLAAALAAARAGSRVVLCEREVVCGGELEFESAAIAGRSAAQWIAEVLRELGELGARVLTQTAVVFGSGGLVLAHRQRGSLPGADAMYRIRPRALVVAMGALDRPIAFVDNDLPGVMLLGAAERYLARYGVRVGASPVLFGNHDRLYAAAARLLGAGVRVRAIVDTRDDAAAQSSGRERDELRRAGIECRTGHAVLAAQGRLAVRAASIAPLASPGTLHEIACDTILVSGGWSPAVHAGLHEDGNPAFEPGIGAFVAAGQPGWRAACGAAAGHLELGAVLSDAFAVGQRAAGAPGDPVASAIARGDAAPYLAPFWRSPANLAGEKRQFVDLQNDVTVADLRQALEEGFRNIEHVKRYTTLGVGTEQGRTASVLGAAIVAELLGKSLAATGMSRTRPPYQPVTLMALCGSRVGAALRPERRTPLHDCHVQQGGVLEPAGLWLRPRFYLANGAEPFQAGVAEAARVRSSGGVFDGSTLGKIEVAGPDAAALLDRLYLTRAGTIKIGRAKYMVNLREDGMVLDDGLVLRLAQDRFLATTSSGHAGHMLSHFEFWRAHFGEHAVTLADVTDAWAVIVVAGPQGRERLADVLGAEWRERLGGLAHMDFASGHWPCPNEFGPTGLPYGGELRVLRASFSGELAFELHCRPRIAPALWQALIRAGLAPYGLEALDILRIEKGYLVDAEINGQTTPQDLGMEGLLKLNNPCVGRELLEREAFRDPERPRLVGLRAADGRSRFLAGAQITALDAPTLGAGHVTSSAYSPALKQWIGLALVARRLAREGDELMARDPVRGNETRVSVVPAVHFDPASERMKA